MHSFLTPVPTCHFANVPINHCANEFIIPNYLPINCQWLLLLFLLFLLQQEFFLCVDDLRHAFPDVTYATDEEDLSIVFLKISSIVVRLSRRNRLWSCVLAPFVCAPRLIID